MLELYSYFRSSAAYRVRIVLAHKQLQWAQLPVNLLQSEQQGAEYLALNPQGLVPALQTDQHLLTQSLAIIEYLEDVYPQMPLLPVDPLAKARVRSLAQQIAVDLHPLNNLRVLKYLQSDLDVSDEDKMKWYRHWIEVGFSALEKSLQTSDCNGKFCFGDCVTLADVCLIPQVYNAKRFECDMSAYPLIESVWKHCNRLPAFKQAQPEEQPDCFN
ncbi:maleylacetoacetate isomerase [Aliamphritea spongicola]|uniref:maleylacetoacetate isomerase n=1 Tax=Aliamphritea spongicola TaxID=707589 RepID=UPI00196BA175|nr:maleylacetoacetate isomerase [Aliamphritea spongicola]MBN3562738.1 maleylacetoacetate isomerase [Aliamphritea spongicola]